MQEGFLAAGVNLRDVESHWVYAGAAVAATCERAGPERLPQQQASELRGGESNRLLRLGRADVPAVTEVS